MWSHTVLGVLSGLLLTYAVLLALLWRYSRTHPEAVTMREALRLLPDPLRSVTRRAGAEALDRNWPGTAPGLNLVRQLAGLSPS